MYVYTYMCFCCASCCHHLCNTRIHKDKMCKREQSQPTSSDIQDPINSEASQSLSTNLDSVALKHFPNFERSTN